ncbi:hypothetical protein ACWT_4549 [Actinoplanes sp. SE50]|uniref:hypothetical protein n=1 Tax=unclassified Actinoplanes TaxID=2626549 RepID=UPI00023ED273|nr:MULTISPECIES: hypothetical protein [unclassified Actinoplanes]AEV85571.1 hypothetical protein ACPL_4680 [Actinoplanes sp. SE50/110]ATO83964.1 hypothetical protein ACWT_4549 [Actinoplanes sp. SE50]SLM01374.1 hypothetical protein ACSP50_4610 [Actinoplanes sp. SE50/110]
MGKSEQSASYTRRLRPPGRQHARPPGTWGLWTPPVDRSGRTVKVALDAERVELKVVATERACRRLDLERHAGQTRRVYFLDTPDLALDRHGLIVRIRDLGGRPDDAVVKLRPMGAHTLPKWLRRTNRLEVEIDAMPGRRVCSGSLKVRLGRDVVSRTVAAGRPLAKLLAQPQRRLLSACGPDGVSLGDLVVLGPVEVRKQKFQPAGFDRQLCAERWAFPDGSTILELSTRCPVGKAPEVAARLTDVLAAHGITPVEPQHTKSDLTLRYFSCL